MANAMNWQLFTAFLLVTLVLIMAPGPVVTLVIATSASKGLRAGLVTVAGSSTGLAAALLIIALGLAFVLNHALFWFELLRWAGAAYLVWLGVQAWRGAGHAAAAPAHDGVQFARGFLAALLNPKVIAFFTAFLPQFVDPSLPAGPQLAVMSAVTAVLAALSDSTWAILASLGRTWFVTPSRSRFIGRLSALALIGGGIWLSFARRPV
jgi:threonine/homoserine/homoserine lactone efflux protein